MDLQSSTDCQHPFMKKIVPEYESRWTQQFLWCANKCGKKTRHKCEECDFGLCHNCYEQQQEEQKISL